MAGQVAAGRYRTSLCCSSCGSRSSCCRWSRSSPILFTGRYPRAIFDFNVGVLRWTWRVGYYSYSALGTDRYPPFTLADVPDLPGAAASSRLPAALSRGLVLVKWWLLALPHYLVIGVFTGGAFAAARSARHLVRTAAA